ncbi:MAG TPA: DUF1559 domain-containing protein [Gemmataceae bacterium]|nr:DUF1559 domain-containing protein [Gemmataceae bacterium]
MIRFQCPCGQLLQSKEEHAGLEITCPACGTASLVPGSEAAIRPAPAPTHGDALPVAEYTPRQPPQPVSPAGRPRPRGAETSGKALSALILGAFTFVVPVLAAIPAIIFAVLALKDIRKRAGQLTGKGLAITGLALAVVGNISILGYVLLWRGMSGPRDPSARERAISQNNLKQIGLAMHNYHDAYRCLPANAIYSKDGKPLLSWRVAILPYIEQNVLYQQFKLDEPWDSPHNKALLQHMPPQYAPVREGPGEPFCTYYQVFTGPNTPFPDVPPQGGPFGARGLRLTEFRDGTSNTLLAAEAGEAVPWTKPADIAISPVQPLPKLGGQWRSGCNVLMADGSVRWVDLRRVSEPTLRALITPSGGEVVPPDWED